MKTRVSCRIVCLSLTALLLLVLLPVHAEEPTSVQTASAAPTPKAAIMVNSEGDDGDAYASDGVCDITGNPYSDPPVPYSGVCTLRAAIETVNAVYGSHSISFAASVSTIRPAGLGLPSIRNPVAVNGSAGGARVELDGSLATSPGASGLNLSASGSTVTGMVIHSFPSYGIWLSGSGPYHIAGNYIGTDPTGVFARPNDSGGIYVGATQAIIGGTEPEQRNVVSGNDGWGITLGSDASECVIIGNFVGVSANGVAALGNSSYGIILFSGHHVIGGSAPGMGNVISGNSTGIRFNGDEATENVIQGNFIGTDRFGVHDLGNSGDGISVGLAANNIIGGSTGTTPGGPCTGACNLISGNGDDGISLASGSTDLATGNAVIGNYIGTTVTGTAPLGNDGDGIYASSAMTNTIAGNVIFANSGRGIYLNWSSGNTVAGNTIAYNTEAGVVVSDWDAVDNRLSRNAFLYNGGPSGLGIDLDGDGVTKNDLGDADTGGNNLQNYPVIRGLDGNIISGTLNSTASTTFLLEFYSSAQCNGSGHGQGQRYLGNLGVSTDSAGNGGFRGALMSAPPSDHVVSATATDPRGNTSEFSACFSGSTPVAPEVAGFSPDGGSGTVGEWSQFTTWYRDGNGYDDIALALLLLDRAPPVASGGFAGAFYQPANLLLLLGGGSCRPGEAKLLSTAYATLDCARISVSGVDDTLSINWTVRPEQCFAGGCGASTAYGYVVDGEGLKDVGVVGTWTLHPASGPAEGSGPAPQATQADMEQLREDIEAWRSLTDLARAASESD